MLSFLFKAFPHQLTLLTSLLFILIFIVCWKVQKYAKLREMLLAQERGSDWGWPWRRARGTDPEKFANIYQKKFFEENS